MQHSVGYRTLCKSVQSEGLDPSILSSQLPLKLVDLDSSLTTHLKGGQVKVLGSRFAATKIKLFQTKPVQTACHEVLFWGHTVVTQ